MEIKLVDKLGKVQKAQKIPKDLPRVARPHRQAIFEAVNVEHQNSRQGTHDTKSKGEVSGTGKKPYRQKHTGRARQGSRRNPQFRGGGVAFGVTPERNYCVKVNKKVSKIALISAWQKVVESGDIYILDKSFHFSKIRTKEFSGFLQRANIQDRKILLVTNFDEETLSLSARNISNLILRSPNGCSVRDLLNQNYMLITEKAIEEFYKRLEWK